MWSRRMPSNGMIRDRIVPRPNEVKESVIIPILNLGRFKMPAIPEARLATRGQTILPREAKQYMKIWASAGLTTQPGLVSAASRIV